MLLGDKLLGSNNKVDELTQLFTLAARIHIATTRRPNYLSCQAIKQRINLIMTKNKSDAREQPDEFWRPRLNYTACQAFNKP